MAHLILGFLMIRSLTIYDIKTALDRKISPFYAASLGSIQAALRKLLTAGHIEFEQAVENGRRKKYYRLTEAGRAAFFHWMNSPIQVNKFNQDALVRVFFFGFLPQPDRIRLLKAYTTEFRAEVEEMVAYQAGVPQPDAADPHRDLIRYQLASLDLGVQQARVELAWFEDLLVRLEKETQENGTAPV